MNHIARGEGFLSNRRGARRRSALAKVARGFSGVTTMRRMFIKASAFNQDLDWCISAGVDVSVMFWGAGCESTSCDVTFDCPPP